MSGPGDDFSSIDDFLIAKDVGKYDLELQPEKAFGLRHKELVRTFPLSVFQAQKQMPTPGMIFYFDNVMGKVTSVSGGRVIVDFNNPLAGKVVQYTLDVKREVIDMNEKAKSLLVFVIRKEPQFRIKSGKLIVKCSKPEAKLMTMLKPRFKEILSLELEPELQKKSKTNQQKIKNQYNKNSLFFTYQSLSVFRRLWDAQKLVAISIIFDIKIYKVTVLLRRYG